MHNIDKTGKWLVFLYVIEYIALLLLLISSITLIQQGFYLLYERSEVSILEILAHLYGFIFANIVLIFMPKAKQIFIGKEDRECDE